MGGGSDTTVVNSPPPPPTQAELDIQGKNSQILSEQLDAIKAQNSYQKNLYDKVGPLFDYQISQMDQQKQLDPLSLELQKQQLNSAIKNGPIQDELLQRQLDQIKNGYAATPEQSRLIDQDTDAQLAAGKSDLSEFSRLGLEQIRNVLAPSAGLRPGDTPITDRGFQLEREGTRQFGQLESGLRSANANAKLNYPLASAGVSNASSQFQQSLQQSVRDFQTQLATQAAQNRLSLGTGVQSLGIQGSSVPGSPFGLTTGLAAARQGVQTGSQSNVSKTAGMGEYGSLAAGLGTAALVFM